MTGEPKPAATMLRGTRRWGHCRRLGRGRAPALGADRPTPLGTLLLVARPIVGETESGGVWSLRRHTTRVHGQERITQLTRKRESSREEGARAGQASPWPLDTLKLYVRVEYVDSRPPGAP